MLKIKSKNKIQTNSGITLIALVVTIVVLLILAGVSLSLVAGGDGIIAKADNAVNATNIASAKDAVNLATSEAIMAYYSDQYLPDGTKSSDPIEKYVAVYLAGKNLKDVTVRTDTKKVIIAGEEYPITEKGVDWGTSAPAGALPAGPTEYAITYYLDGGTANNPSKYTSESSDITLNAPTKSGYVFLGWTEKEGDTPSKTVTIASGSTGAKSYTANWRKMQTWTQTGTTVTDGEVDGVTLNVGDVITGYDVTVTGSWAVLGAEDGKLLITTTSNQGEDITLGEMGNVEKSQYDYVHGVETLDDAASAYKDSPMATKARSMKVEDINRVTGYVDNVYNAGTTNSFQTGNKVTYTLNSSDNKVHYIGTKAPIADKTSSYTSFTYWTGSTWKKLVSGESATLDHNYYNYYPHTLTTAPSAEGVTAGTIGGNAGTEGAYNLIFTNGDGTQKTYWLGSQYVSTYAGHAYFGLHRVTSGRVDGYYLYYSDGKTYVLSCGLRPVVSLKSEVKVTADKELSL